MVCSKASPESNALVRALDWAVIFEGHLGAGIQNLKAGSYFLKGKSPFNWPIVITFILFPVLTTMRSDRGVCSQQTSVPMGHIVYLPVPFRLNQVSAEVIHFY